MGVWHSPSGGCRMNAHGGTQSSHHNSHRCFCSHTVEWTPACNGYRIPYRWSSLPTPFDLSLPWLYHRGLTFVKTIWHIYCNDLITGRGPFSSCYEWLRISLSFQMQSARSDMIASVSLSCISNNALIASSMLLIASRRFASLFISFIFVSPPPQKTK